MRLFAVLEQIISSLTGNLAIFYKSACNKSKAERIEE